MSHIIVVIDKSLSMKPIANSVISGFNEFLHSQQKIVDSSTLTLLEFSDTSNVIFKNRLISEVQPMESFEPEGMTALNDAIGDALRIDPQNPNTLVLIITDGWENSSTRFETHQIREMISRRKSLGWKFIYMCNNTDVSSAGISLGLQMANAHEFNPSCQNLIVNHEDFGATLSRDISDATCEYRSSGGSMRNISTPVRSHASHQNVPVRSQTSHQNVPVRSRVSLRPPASSPPNTQVSSDIQASVPYDDELTGDDDVPQVKMRLSF